MSDGLRTLLRLAGPIIIVQVGQQVMGSVDVMMVGRLSGDAMASVSIGNSWLWLLTVFGVGVLMVTDPLFSQAYGARDEDAISRTMQRALAWALLLTAPLMSGIVAVEPVLHWTGQPEELIPDGVLYTRIASLGTFPLLLYTVFRQAVQAHNRVWPLIITMLAVNVVNALANYVLIFGALGVPPMGVAGSAWATVLSRWLMALGLGWASWPLIGRHVLAFRDRAVRERAFRVRPMLRMFTVGMPIGLQISLELGVFTATTLTIGSLGAVEVAGHQVVLNLASMSFMVPIGLGTAGAVLIGNAIGRGDMAGARSEAKRVLTVAAIAMAMFAVLFIAVPHPLAWLYTDEPAVLAVAVLLLPIAGVFQIADGLQAVAAGVLRGVGDTRTAMFCNAIGFWVIGFSMGLWLCFERGLGAAGMWWGFVIGLGAVALLLLIFVRRRLATERVRLSVD